jgi:hypothetical protein
MTVLAKTPPLVVAASDGSMTPAGRLAPEQRALMATLDQMMATMNATHAKLQSDMARLMAAVGLEP